MRAIRLFNVTAAGNWVCSGTTCQILGTIVFTPDAAILLLLSFCRRSKSSQKLQVNYSDELCNLHNLTSINHIPCPALMGLKSTLLIIVYVKMSLLPAGAKGSSWSWDRTWGGSADLGRSV